jgi:diguanylate cyclase (GGDEF)-like protein
MSTLAASAPFAEGRIEAITISIGVATSATEASLNALMKVADDALYRAKEMGRNRVELGPVEASDG